MVDSAIATVALALKYIDACPQSCWKDYEHHIYYKGSTQGMGFVWAEKSEGRGRDGAKRKSQKCPTCKLSVKSTTKRVLTPY